MICFSILIDFVGLIVLQKDYFVVEFKKIESESGCHECEIIIIL